jgi:adenine-specific DNA-methyltransferase
MPPPKQHTKPIETELKMPAPSSDNTTMNGDSLSVGEQRKQELKRLFPGVFTETKDDAGELIETIDFERLKAELGEFSEVYDNRRERYGMDWSGKRDCLRAIQVTSQATLKPCREESVDFDSTQNLFIEGDNLEVLKLLQKSYYGKVKMIYIDPPYNTGKEFIYPDNFTESLDTYLQYAGLKGSDGRKFSTNSANEGRFHTKWLNMMYPRLYLARNLLKEDGVIFISIDDNEVENLRRMCDEIFGEENFVGTVIWKNATDNNPTNIAIEHEYVHVYCKNKMELETEWKTDVSDVKELLVRKGIELASQYENLDILQGEYTKWHRDYKTQLWPLDRYKYIDRDGIYTGSQSVHNPGKEGYRYDVIHPKTGRPCKEPLMGYRFPKDSMSRLLDEEKIIFGEDHNKIIELKVYAKDYREKLSGVIDLDGRLGSYDIRELFPEHTKAFTNPKPVRLLQLFIPFVLKNSGDIVLDFFAGSCSTADSITRLNLQDKIKRKYIMVQLPELISNKAEMSLAGYRTISDISKERVRRAGNKIRNDLADQLDLEGNKNLDLGFKVLKLAQSNFKQWQAPNKDITDTELLKQIELNVDHIDPNASPEDLLYELLIKAGVMPTENIESIEIAEHPIFSVADESLLIHLGDSVDQKLIDAVLAKAPQQFICLDKAFDGNDQLKANAVKTFATFNQGKEKIDQIDFKTV